MGLQTIVSRHVNITEAPAIVTVGRFTGGNRSNIVPKPWSSKVPSVPTTRAFARTSTIAFAIATHYAEAAGGTATVEIGRGTAYPVTINDPALTERMLPTFVRVAGANNGAGLAVGVAEDFAFFQQSVPASSCLGVTPRGQDHTTVAQNHSPLFFADESALPVGVRTMTNLALDYPLGGK